MCLQTLLLIMSLILKVLKLFYFQSTISAYCYNIIYSNINLLPHNIIGWCLIVHVRLPSLRFTLAPLQLLLLIYMYMYCKQTRNQPDSERTTLYVAGNQTQVCNLTTKRAY